MRILFSLRILGLLLMIFSITMIFPMLISLSENGHTALTFLNALAQRLLLHVEKDKISDIHALVLRLLSFDLFFFFSPFIFNAYIFELLLFSLIRLVFVRKNAA